MPEKLFYAITNLGDSAVTGALSVSLIVYLLILRQKRAALAVGAAFAVAALIIAVGKIALYSRCDLSEAPFGLRSPSGHTAISVAVYGLFAALVAASQTGRRRIIPYLVAVPLIGLIAASRVVLSYHTTGDVIAGLIVSGGLSVWRLGGPFCAEKRCAVPGGPLSLSH
ncbi:MAG: phosphatase PAP2 family protein [Alphaproteobacteria bacterium]